MLSRKGARLAPFFQGSTAKVRDEVLHFGSNEAETGGPGSFDFEGAQIVGYDFAESGKNLVA